MTRRTWIALGVLLALTAAGCDDEARTRERTHETERRAAALEPGRDPLALARRLRERGDPSPLSLPELGRFDRREVLRPSRPAREADEAGIRAVLAGFAREADRSQLPEFTAARLPEGRSIREHLHNAILMNTSRAGYYAELAGELRQRSLWLSRTMVAGETLSLTNAARWDREAAGLRARGLPPLEDDLVPLRPLPRETPPTWRGVASAEQRRQVARLADALSAELRRDLEAGDLEQVTLRCHAALEQLIRWEEAWGVHWQMTRHTIGSIGYAALRGAAHADPERRALSRRYLRSLVDHTIPYGQTVDRLAQPLHARGLGFVVNEFTDQPFLQAMAARRAGLVDAVGGAR